MGRRVLVVDDHADTREAFALMLALDGHTVLSAASGEDALAMLREDEPYGLVLLDWRMPGMGGDLLLRVVRAEARPLRDTPVIVTSADGLSDGEAREAGADGFLQKPIDPDVLLPLVRWLSQ